METLLLKITETDLKDFEAQLRANGALKDIQVTKTELLLLYQLAQLEKRLKTLEERC